MLLQTHEEEEEVRKEEKKVAHPRFSSDKDASPPSCSDGRSVRDTFFQQPNWKESGGTAALVLLGCIAALEVVEEGESFSEMPCRRERG